MSLPVLRLRSGAAVIAAIVLAALPACSAGHYQHASCRSTGHSVFLLEAQAVPSATYVPCIIGPLPVGWSLAGQDIRSGRARIWLDSDRGGAHAAEAELTRTCDVSRAHPVTVEHGPPGLQRFEEPDHLHPGTSVALFVFRGGCVTYRLAFTRNVAPAIFRQADRFLGFTPRSLYVKGVRKDTGGLSLCGAEAPPCPG